MNPTVFKQIWGGFSFFRREIECQIQREKFLKSNSIVQHQLYFNYSRMSVIDCLDSIFTPFDVFWFTWRQQMQTGEKLYTAWSQTLASAHVIIFILLILWSIKNKSNLSLTIFGWNEIKTLPIIYEMVEIRSK